MQVQLPSIRDCLIVYSLSPGCTHHRKGVAGAAARQYILHITAGQARAGCHVLQLPLGSLPGVMRSATATHPLLDADCHVQAPQARIEQVRACDHLQEEMSMM